MGLIRSLQAANLFAKIAVLVLALACFFNFSAFIWSTWGLSDESISNDDTKRGYGFWKACTNEDTPNCLQLDGWRLEWYGWFQAFGVVAFVAVNLAFSFIVLAVFVPQCIGNKDVTMASAISSIVGAVAYLICVIIFGVKFDETYDVGFDAEEFSSGFAFGIIIIILCVVAAILIFLGANGGKVNPDGDKPNESSGAKQQQKA